MLKQHRLGKKDLAEQLSDQARAKNKEAREKRFAKRRDREREREREEGKEGERGEREPELSSCPFEDGLKEFDERTDQTFAGFHYNIVFCFRKQGSSVKKHFFLKNTESFVDLAIKIDILVSCDSFDTVELIECEFPEEGWALLIKELKKYHASLTDADFEYSNNLLNDVEIRGLQEIFHSVTKKGQPREWGPALSALLSSASFAPSRRESPEPRSVPVMLHLYNPAGQQFPEAPAAAPPFRALHVPREGFQPQYPAQPQPPQAPPVVVQAPVAPAEQIAQAAPPLEAENPQPRRRWFCCW